MRHVVKFRDPQGRDSFLCRAAPGKTADPLAAVAFLTADIARGAARAVIFGDPAAFWNSERRHAENTRREHKGWSFEVIPVSEFPSHPLGVVA